MERVPNFEAKKESDKNEDIELKSIGKEKMEELLKEYKDDPDGFYVKNGFVLWDEDKNPALFLTMEMLGYGVLKVMKDKGVENPNKIAKDAKDVAMLVAKYLGSDIEGWCKVSIETSVEINNKIMEEAGKNQQKNYEYIIEKIRRNDPVFSEFLTKLCVYDQKTGENRSLDEVSAMMEVVVWVAKTMYEQMLKDAKIN